MHLYTFLLLLLVLVACGQKGPLFLPEDAQGEESKKVTSALSDNMLPPISVAPSTTEKLKLTKISTFGFETTK
jgi:predicted small lipoprotein YifL